MSQSVVAIAVRRAVLGLLGVGLFMAMLTPAEAYSGAAPFSANSATGIRFRAVVVDASPLAASVTSNYAQTVRQALEPQLRSVFADRLAPGDPRAPTLVVRIDFVNLGEFDRRRRSFRGGSASDYMRGVGLVVGPGRSVLSDTPLLTRLDTGAAGNFFVDSAISDARRLDAISYQFAYSLKQELGL